MSEGKSLREKRKEKAKVRAFDTWLEMGGNPTKFEDEWPKIWRDYLRRKAIDGAMSSDDPIPTRGQRKVTL
jgi:hypothetical protein